MGNLTKIELKNLPMETDIFDKIGKQWMLISAGNEEKANFMTASWGNVGIMWNKPILTAYVRKSRYTYEFTEKNDTFAITFLKPEHKSTHKVFGSMSGRNVNKTAETGLTEIMIDGVPTYAEAECVIVCKKLYSDDIKAENFIDKGCLEHYADNDFHTFYMAEILAVYQNI